ncbi:MAG TPA: hypothetical protein VJ927_04630 [Actinomycetota bacterium]|nr:hypothetical protein [Actinomycetota bacterium]
MGRGSGDSVISLDQTACRTSPPDADDIDARERLPSPSELAWIAADRAMRVAEWPQLQVAPRRAGLTGLRSYFWLDRRPRPVTASASVPGMVVTAFATPERFVWDFGDGPVRATTHVGRPWTRRRAGSIGHLYETRGTYALGLEVVWRASWQINGGAWRHLGYFTNGDEARYPVRQMVAMLTRRR